MKAERPSRREDMFPPGVIKLTDARTAEAEVLKHLRTTNDHIKFGITYDVLNAGLQHEQLPFGAEVDTFKFKTNPKDRTESLFIVEGSVKVRMIHISFGVAFGNEKGKICIEASRPKMLGTIVNSFDPDSKIKEEINTRINSIGAVTECSIGDGVFECTIKKNEGSTMKVSLFIR